MAKADKQQFNISENFLSLGLGILVVVVVGALIFNYVSNRSANKGETTPTAEQGQEEEQKETAPIALPTKHKVAVNEDLWKISERYYKTGYNWTDIANANNLSDPNVLLVDSELIIPAVEPKVLAVSDTIIKNEIATPTSPKAITGDSYTVTPGDNLWEIAIRAYGDGYKWVEIANANSLANPDLIHAGNVLTIPR